MSISPDRSLAQQLSSAFTLFGALVAVGFVATALAYGACWGWLTPELEQSRLAIQAESASEAAMIDQENGLRGYRLTRDINFIAPYTYAEVALARANAALTASAGSVSELAAPMLATRLAEERWRERWATPSADLRSDAAAPSMSEGKALFDDYRTEEVALAAALRRHSALAAGREQRVISGRVALELVVFLVIFFLAMRQHGALRDSIVAPVAALLRHIGRVRDGQLEETVDPAGPRELRQLGEGLNDMVRALAVARECAQSRDARLHERSVQLRQILDASREFSESLNLAYVVGAVRASTAAVGGYERVIVWIMDDDQKRLVDAVGSGSTATESSDFSLEMGHGLAGRAAKSGRITFEGPAGQVRFGDGNTGSVRAIAIPLIVGARVVGALEARHGVARVV
ncbi:MAG TPA: CHASE3 domain-containing protein, partial [Polyangiaceae bacterium]